MPFKKPGTKCSCKQPKRALVDTIQLRFYIHFKSTLFRIYIYICATVMPTSPVKTRIPLTSFGHLISEVKVDKIIHCVFNISLPCMLSYKINKI